MEQNYRQSQIHRSYTNIPELTSSHSAEVQQEYQQNYPYHTNNPYYQEERPQTLQHSQSFPVSQIRRPNIPAPIQINTPIAAPLQFAAPPKTPTQVALPTSTFIPNINYAQAGFAAPPITPVQSVHSKSTDNLHYYYTQEPIPPVPQIQDIHVFSPSKKDASLFAYNSEVNNHIDRIRREKEMSGYPNQPNGEIPLQSYQGAPTFDPPPTEPLAQQPEPHQPMEYQAPPLFDNGSSQPHAPGQIAHPNQLHGEQQYKSGLCGCFGDMGSCCLGCWCPCMLYGKTHHRLKTVPDSNLDNYSTCNSHCAIWCVLSPVSWVFTMLQRTRIRELYQIKGSPIGDCAKAYYCPVCTLVQDEREIREREDEKRRCAGPGSGIVGEQGYKKPEKMAYQRSSVIG